MYLAGIGARLFRTHVGRRTPKHRHDPGADPLSAESSPPSPQRHHRHAGFDVDYDGDVDYPDGIVHHRNEIVTNAGAADKMDADMVETGCGPMSSCRDITAQMADLIGDVQGIQWSSLAMTRDSYRKTRIEKYQQFNSQEAMTSTTFASQPDDVDAVDDTDTYLQFVRNVRRGAPTILHFQLRHLVSALSNDVVLTMNSNRVFRCNTGTQAVELVLDLSGAGPMDSVAISTIHNDGRLLFAGGFNGEIVVQNLETGQVVKRQRLTSAENAISNSLTTSAGMLFASNNDNFVQVLDLDTMQPLNRYDFDAPVNHCSSSSDGNLLCMVGDTTTGYIIDRRADRQVAKLVGHHDFSFASSWHPHRYVVATGNQDRTCRVWDLRNTASSTATLGGRLAAIRSVRFSPDGAFLGVAEAADFLHIYDGGGQLRTSQTMDYFGELAGFDWSPDARTMFVGISDQIYGAMLQYERRSLGLVPDMLL